MKRREFITLLGGTAAAWPLAAWAQQPAMPVIGYFSGRSPDAEAPIRVPFLQALEASGFAAGHNVAIEYRFAHGRDERLPELAAELVRRQVTMLVATDRPSASATKAVRERPDALFVAGDAFLSGRRVQLAQLAAFHRLPATYALRDYAEAGGLMSYGPSIKDAFRQIGVYTGRILKGAKPADLPVVQPNKFELVINAGTARMLGLDVPPTLLARADEVIE
jgi:ABC-type uncharacterized transport system substrate-binding protein